MHSSWECAVTSLPHGGSSMRRAATHQLGPCCAQVASCWQGHEALCLHSSWEGVASCGSSSCSTLSAQLTGTDVLLAVVPAEQYPEKPPRVRFTSDM